MNRIILILILVALVCAFAAGRYSNPQPVVKLVPYTPERQAAVDRANKSIESQIWGDGLLPL